MNSLEEISNEVTVLEAERDFGDITPEGLELLAVLNLCYDLLSRTQAAQSVMIEQPEEMKEPGFNDDFVNKYGIASSQLADFAFAITTRKGSVDMRSLLKEAMSRQSQKNIAQAVGIRPSTISEYLNHKSSFNVDSYESIINFTIKK